MPEKIKGRSINVLHIVSGDLNGGAARGACWLHEGLLDLGVTSRIFTNSKSTFGHEHVTTVAKSKKDKVFTLLRGQLDSLLTAFYPQKKKVIFSSGIFGIDFTKTVDYKKADVIHLHWINGGFVNIKHINNVDKPIIWTMRDMWPMTGGCHVAAALACEKYKTGCGHCVQLNSNSSYDLSSFILNRKKKYLPKHIRLVGISRWLSSEARKSQIFKEFDVQTISNSISTVDFFPIDKELSRKILGINTTKKIILTGSTTASDFHKGFDKFKEAVGSLDKSKYFLCFFGNLDESEAKMLGFEYKNFGYLNDNISLRLVYSCADVFISPSLMDAFGKTLAEAMSCGTPSVCFDATGPKDIVSHKVDGYKAIPFDSADLACGMDWVLNATNYEELCQNARDKVVREFDSKVIAQQYIKLYQSVLP